MQPGRPPENSLQWQGPNTEGLKCMLCAPMCWIGAGLSREPSTGGRRLCHVFKRRPVKLLSSFLLRDLFIGASQLEGGRSAGPQAGASRRRSRRYSAGSSLFSLVRLKHSLMCTSPGRTQPAPDPRHRRAAYQGDAQAPWRRPPCRWLPTGRASRAKFVHFFRCAGRAWARRSAGRSAA